MRLRLRLAAAIASLAVVLGVVSPLSAAALARPGAVKSATAAPGAKVGQLKVTWKASGASTDVFRVETALTPFGGSGKPKHGRSAKVFTVDGNKRSLTLSAARVRAAGAGPETGNHLYVRVTAVNTSKSGSRSGTASPLVAGMARPSLPATTGTPLRVASFNVRSAYYGHEDPRTWLQRAPDVAREIIAAKPGVVAVQEASSGRADGQPGGTGPGVPRQTESLADALVAQGGPQYRIVRRTSYNPPGTVHGSQAARIVYDSSRYTLLSICPDTTGPEQWSSSCSIELPILPTDAESWRRTAAYAEFRDLRTGQAFLLVSAHLDYRHSKDAALERSYNDLRGMQAAAIDAAAEVLRGTGEPVIVAGDLNSAQADAGGYGAHDYLVGVGYYDTVAAQKRVNLAYPSLNKFAVTLKKDPQGFARRIDAILVNGARGAKRFEVVTKKTDRNRTSDHSMVLADVVLPATR